MTRFMLLTGAAALAIASAATAAPQDKNNRSAKAERSQKASKAKANKARANRGEIRVAARQSRERRVEARGKARERANARVELRRDKRQNVRLSRDERRDWIDNRREARDDRRDERRLARLDRWEDRDRGGVWVNGCPPGLAKKRPDPCVPPGQAKTYVGQPLRVVSERLTLRELPSRLRYSYRDNDDYYYRYGNGYVYRVDRDNDLISALLPLFGLGVGVGQPFPASYANALLPTGLQSFYPDSPFTSYRFANGYVYEIDPLTGLVEDVDPMLGYGYGYGQMMPATYSAYNVPYQYRSLYQDNDDYLYRYAPGSIYRVDAGSGLIDSVAALLTPGGLSVGQPLPMGYDAYNVPYAYRSQYYDTPQSMYRYSNGSIYQVDPTTRLVTAIISALI